MKVLCETMFNYLIPSSVRSVITKELIETYGYTQEQAAEKLGVTQPAISQYLNGLRGKKINQILSNKELMDWIKKISSTIVSGELKLNEGVCSFCAQSKKIEDDETKPLKCLMEVYERMNDDG